MHISDSVLHWETVLLYCVQCILSRKWLKCASLRKWLAQRSTFISSNRMPVPFTGQPCISTWLGISGHFEKWLSNVPYTIFIWKYIALQTKQKKTHFYTILECDNPLWLKNSDLKSIYWNFRINHFKHVKRKLKN